MNRSMHLLFMGALLGSLSAEAFSPDAKGWYAESEVGPSISYTCFTSSLSDSAKNSLVGLSLRESVAWRRWAVLDIKGAYALSVGGEALSSSLYLRNSPARIYTWDADALLYTSISVEKMQTVFLEPAIGFSSIGAHMRRMESDDMRKWTKIKCYGPSLGFYMRLFLAPKFSLRVGGSYIAAQASQTTYDTNGIFDEKRTFRARRHGLSALFRTDYKLRDWIGLFAGIDYQSWSSGIDEDGVYSLKRTRLSWGAECRY